MNQVLFNFDVIIGGVFGFLISIYASKVQHKHAQENYIRQEKSKRVEKCIDRLLIAVSELNAFSDYVGTLEYAYFGDTEGSWFKAEEICNRIYADTIALHSLELLTDKSKRQIIELNKTVRYQLMSLMVDTVPLRKRLDGMISKSKRHNEKAEQKIGENYRDLRHLVCHLCDFVRAELENIGFVEK